MAGKPVDMSLDEIISLNRKNRKTSGNLKRGGKRSFGGGGARRPLNRNNFGYRDLDDPEQIQEIRKASFRNGQERGSTLVRLNLSNLAPSVSSADLEELFGRFNIEAATVHYNELGESLGTGDVYLPKGEAHKIMREFDGVALDNRILNMVILDGKNNTADRGKRFPVQRTTRFKNQPNRKAGPNAGRQGGGRQKPQKTIEELDAELDAYMQKS